MSVKYITDRAGERYFTHKWVDVEDRKGKWLEAQVREISIPRRSMLVHYKGFSKKYDEWLDPNDVRVAPLHRYTTPGRRYPRVPRVVGTQLDVLDTLNKWYAATIVAVNHETQQVKVHYINFKTKWDEWLDFDSYRMAPLRTFSRPRQRRQVKKKEAPPDLEKRYAHVLLHEHGLRIEQMAPDGNCLFRSFSHLVYGTPEHHMVVRQQCLAYLKAHEDFFRGYVFDEEFDDYLDRMSYSGEWGGEVEIRAMGELYGRPVEIYIYSTQPRQQYPGVNPTAYPIRLSYHWNSHYNAITKSHDDEAKRALLTTAPGVFEQRRIREMVGLQRSEELTHEEQQMRLALQQSREDCENRDFDQAFEQIVLERDIAQAQQESMAEELDAALLLSAQQASERDVDEASVLAAAKYASEQEEFERQLAQAAALSVKDAGAGAEPEPITTCIAMGFPRANVEQAFTIFDTPGVSPDVITSNMVQHLSSM